MSHEQRIGRAGTPAILVVGDVMLDIIAAPERAIAFATDTPAQIMLLPGGSGANQAAWLAHFGNAVTFIARVGHEAYAEHVAALRLHGVEPILARDESTRSGVLVTLIGAAGERSFLTDRGANANLRRADLADEPLDQVDHVHISGYAFSSPGARAAVRDYVALIVEHGIPFSVDAGSAGFLRDVGPEAFFEWTAAAAICFANATEAALLVNSVDPAEQLRRLGSHYAMVLVTSGADGAGAASANGSERWFAGTAKVEPVDTSGAGDAFVAGFLSAHLRGEHVGKCLRQAVDAGARAVLHYGGRPSTHTMCFPAG